MVVKEQIVKAVRKMESAKLLNRLFSSHLGLVRIPDNNAGGNRNNILQLAGSLSNEDGLRINKSINDSCHQIEGEW